MAPLTPQEKLQLLSHVELFSGLSKRQLEGVGRVARVKSLMRREELFHKGDEGRQIYVVASGKLKALTTSMSGDDVVFNILGPGEAFGEVALLSSHTRTASIYAIEDCELLVIDSRDFMSFIKTQPEIAINLLHVLATRLKRVSELVEDTQFLNLSLRLAKKIYALARIYGEDTGSGIRIDLKLSQEEWGDLVGATRESINKQLRKWTEDDIVRTEKGYLVLTKPVELEKLAGAIVD